MLSLLPKPGRPGAIEHNRLTQPQIILTENPAIRPAQRLPNNPSGRQPQPHPQPAILLHLPSPARRRLLKPHRRVIDRPCLPGRQPARQDDRALIHGRHLHRRIAHPNGDLLRRQTAHQNLGYQELQMHPDCGYAREVADHEAGRYDSCGEVRYTGG